MKVAQDLVYHSKTKHFAIQLKYVQELIRRGLIQVIHVPSTQQTIDIFTKSFEKTNFARCQQMFGLLILGTNKDNKDK